MAVWVALVSVAIIVAFVGVVILASLPVARRLCRVPVCNTDRATARARSAGEQSDSIARWSHHSALDLVDSSWLPGRPGRVLVGAWRLVCLAYWLFGVLFQGLAPESVASGLDPEYLIYYTNWTYTFFGFHALLGTVLSVRGIARGAAAPAKYDALDALSAAVFATTPACALFLAAFYWAVLWGGEKVLLENMWKHGINVVMLLIDIFLSAVPLSSPWVIFPTAYSSIYLVFLWIYYAFSDDWVYETLDFLHVGNLGYYVALPCLVLVAFWIMFVFILLRDLMANLCGARRGRRAQAGDWQQHRGAEHKVDVELVMRS